MKKVLCSGCDCPRSWVHHRPWLRSQRLRDFPRDKEKTASDHMVAEALLTAHFIAAAQRAGMSDAEINAVLTQDRGRNDHLRVLDQRRPGQSRLYQHTRYRFYVSYVHRRRRPSRALCGSPDRGKGRSHPGSDAPGAGRRGFQIRWSIRSGSKTNSPDRHIRRHAERTPSPLSR